MKTFRPVNLLILAWGIFAPIDTEAQEAAVPAEFDYVGTYEVKRKVKLREGERFETIMKPFLVRIFTDGITLRLYGGGENGGYTKYELYRGEGIIEAPDRTAIETVAGVQASSMVGGVLRNLTLTQRRMSVVSHPAVSGVVEVIYGKRRTDLDLNSNAKR